MSRSVQGPHRVRELARRSVHSVGAGAVVLATAAACAFVLQYSSHLVWSERWGPAIILAPLDVAVLVVVVALVWSLLGRLWWTVATVVLVTGVIAAANRAKIELRREPLYPSDREFVSDPGFLASMVDPRLIVTVVVIGVVLVGTLVLTGRVAARWFPPPRVWSTSPRRMGWTLEARLAAFVLSAGLLLHAADFNEPGNLWRAAYESTNEGWRPWSQLKNYHDNGFVGGFLYNMPVGAMERPADYGPEALEEVAGRYERRAEEINASRSQDLSEWNVVFVLSESFTDPAQMQGFRLDEDPVPRTRQLMADTLSGTLFAHNYGGGTATMEFESLTGQSLGLFRPQILSPFQQFVADDRTYPSVVGSLGALGHRTVAVHAFNLGMYKRTKVYDTLGFDTVVDEESMRSTERIDGVRYISDEAAFGEAFRQLQSSDEPSFVHLVTMQNHGGYPASGYSDPIGSDVTEESTASEIGQYARGLEHSDRAFTRFLAQVRRLERPTVVVFYGDHHPGVYSQEIIDANPPDAIFTTPFLIWNSEANSPQRIEAASTASFLPLLYEAADARVPPYVALLDDVRLSFGALQHGRWIDAGGRTVREDALDDADLRRLRDLRLVQYDFAMGQRSVLQRMWPQDRSDE